MDGWDSSHVSIGCTEPKWEEKKGASCGVGEESGNS